MAQYYGVERSSDCLAHYGVKGMKWRVRKALKKDQFEHITNSTVKLLNICNI